MSQAELITALEAKDKQIAKLEHENQTLHVAAKQ